MSLKSRERGKAVRKSSAAAQAIMFLGEQTAFNPTGQVTSGLPVSTVRDIDAKFRGRKNMEKGGGERSHGRDSPSVLSATSDDDSGELSSTHEMSPRAPSVVPVSHDDRSYGPKTKTLRFDTSPSLHRGSPTESAEKSTAESTSSTSEDSGKRSHRKTKRSNSLFPGTSLSDIPEDGNTQPAPTNSRRSAATAPPRDAPTLPPTLRVTPPHPPPPPPPTEQRNPSGHRKQQRAVQLHPVPKTMEQCLDDDASVASDRSHRSASRKPSETPSGVRGGTDPSRPRLSPQAPSEGSQKEK